ncbi:hypothetical protein AGMMS49944_22170 [Spirochaetia bacterium]|nr:hypothetical protein AGMMS49944_22170 [Spirochaetia bacterium]
MEPKRSSTGYILLHYLPIEERTYALYYESVSISKLELRFVPYKFRDAKMISTITHFNGVLKFIPHELKTYAMCLDAVTRNPYDLHYVPKKFKTLELCTMAVMYHYYSLRYVPKRYKTEEFIELIHNEYRRRYGAIPWEYMDFRELRQDIEAAIKKDGYLYLGHYANPSKTKAADVEAVLAHCRGDLARIKSIIIHVNIISALEPLFKIGALEKIEIEGYCNKSETELPESIGNCRGLKTISLPRLVKIPEWLRRLPALSKLSLNGIKSTVLPDWIGELSSLTSLNLNNLCAVETLPDTMVNLPALTELRVTNSRITSLPGEIGKITSLVTVTVSNTEITALPESIGNLASLVSLNVSDNDGLSSLPDSIGNLHSLETLDLSSTNLVSLPDSIGNLTALKELNLANSPLIYLPESLGNLKNLTRLDIRSTPLKILPGSFDKLTALDTIDISKTKIESLPPSIDSIENVINIPQIELIREEGTLCYGDFVEGYYRTVEKVFVYNTKARREGLLSLEEELDWLKEGFFKQGIRMIVDGVDEVTIRFILSNYIEREQDHYRKKLKQIQMEGILGIQSGMAPALLILMLNSMVHIPGDRITKLCLQYLDGNSNVFDQYLLQDALLKKTDREEVRFILRAVEIAQRALKEGLPALKNMLDKEAVVGRDIFEYGILFVIDGRPKECIEKILSNLIEHETDPWKKNLQKAKKTAVWSIQEGDTSGILAMKLLSFFGADVRAIMEKA